jgi:type IV secretory pathway VirB6-like protein
MNYFRSLGLVFLCIVAPIAAGMSLFPYTSNWFNVWIKSYIHMSMQAFTLEVFSILNSATFKAETVGLGDPSLTPFGSISNFALTLIMMIAIFGTPVWTSKFVSGGMNSNLAGGVGKAVQSLSRKIPGVGKFF